MDNQVGDYTIYLISILKTDTVERRRLEDFQVNLYSVQIKDMGQKNDIDF